MYNNSIDEKGYEYLCAKVDDCRKSIKFVGFLTPREEAQIKEYIKNKPYINGYFFGGYKDSERKFFTILPDYLSNSCDEELIEKTFPIEPLTILYNNKFKLSHRDFLGAIIAIGITRESIGDILVGDNYAIIFIKKELSQFISSQISKIGNVGVKIQVGSTKPLPTNQDFEIIKSTIQSQRLDCVVATIINLSRNETCNIIKKCDVMLNYFECDNISKNVCENDIVTIRHYGKFIIEKIGPLTKKGRLSITAKKYK